MKKLTTIRVTILMASILLSLSSCSSNKSDKFINELCDCFSKYKNTDELKNASNNEQMQIKKHFTTVWNEIKTYENTLNQDEKDKFENEMDNKIKTCNCSTILSNIDPQDLLSDTNSSSTLDTLSSSNIDTANTNSNSSPDNQASSVTDQTSSGSSEDWDKVISDYSSFVDQYIELLKKAKKGNASAMSDASDLMQKAQDLDSKLQSAQSSLSSSQAARLVAIEGKMAQAAAELSK